MPKCRLQVKFLSLVISQRHASQLQNVLKLFQIQTFCSVVIEASLWSWDTCRWDTTSVKNLSLYFQFQNSWDQRCWNVCGVVVKMTRPKLYSISWSHCLSFGSSQQPSWLDHCWVSFYKFWGCIFSHVQTFYERAMGNLDRSMHRSLWV